MNRQLRINKLDSQIEKLKKERARLLEGWNNKKTKVCTICREPLSLSLRGNNYYCDFCSSMSEGEEANGKNNQYV